MYDYQRRKHANHLKLGGQQSPMLIIFGACTLSTRPNLQATESISADLRLADQTRQASTHMLRHSMVVLDVVVMIFFW